VGNKFTVKQHRLIKGMTQENVSEKLGVHVNTYASWEKDPERISIATSKMLAAIFNVSVDDIIFLPYDSTKCRM